MTGRWSIHSSPKIISQNLTGSRVGSGKCGRIWGGADSRASLLVVSRDWQYRIKCSAFSGPEPHGLQVGSPGSLLWVRCLREMGTPQNGDPGPHIPSDMGAGGPHITRDVGPWGPQNSGDMGTLQ